MNFNGSTILITGGGSGIGRGLAEAFHTQGAQVIIAGRRLAVLTEVAAANPGMTTADLDIADQSSIKRFAEQISRDHPTLDVLVNNAGIMLPESFTDSSRDSKVAEMTVATNLLGPMLLTNALLPALRARPQATIINVSSGLAFVPLAAFPTYCATKAAIHSYSQALRRQMQGSHVDVIELIPPYVQTMLTGEAQANDPNAMPLAEFITEVMDLLAQNPTPGEVAVKRVEFMTLAQTEQRYAAAFEALNAH